MSEGGVRGLVVAHASIAAGLVEGVRQIAGVPEEVLLPLSNIGCGPDALRQRLEEALGSGPAVVFTDLGSGSCAFAARRVALERPDTAVVTGVNLPILLDFVFHRDLSLPELVERLVEKGRAGVTGTSREGAHADRAVSR
jgi:mannose/fructose-specific phosphotransferase system component IIA